MNEWNRLHRQAEQYKAAYPPGTRIVLLHMGNDPRPVEDTVRGTVTAVDDIGTFRKLTDVELAEEQAPPIRKDQTGPVMMM